MQKVVVDVEKRFLLQNNIYICYMPPIGKPSKQKSSKETAKASVPKTTFLNNYYSKEFIKQYFSLK